MQCADLISITTITHSNEADKEGNINIFGLCVLLFFSGFLLAIVLNTCLQHTQNVEMILMEKKL
ncbi:hypothetical protein TYRP_022255 [Tyrophagus putrescentiae]|nr:hypothetical protein TYRP_022255 [Tyrophagus putrescentiae]